MKTFILGIFLGTCTISFSQHTVHFRILSLPGNSSDSIFLAGSFNGWQPADKRYLFQKDNTGNYYLDTRLNDGAYEYKLTAGSWKKVECQKTGVGIANRSLTLMNDTLINLSIEDWADRYAVKERKSTRSKNVFVIDTAFAMPQLGRTRRVWIYLPPGYNSSRKKYPVLYMHDGQNVFDELTSFAGEWGVDETLDSIGSHVREMIVVAVDHGGPKRTNEYCPYDMEKFGKGEGDQYVDFLVKTLKPFIDKSYRTVKDRTGTFIAGSSMGGIISMYAVLKYPKIFGGAGVFSPAFWIGPKIYDDIKAKGAAVNSAIYFYCGQAESETMEPLMMKAFDEMRKVSKSRMITSVKPGAKHSESAWRQEFPLFYIWMMEQRIPPR